MVLCPSCKHENRSGRKFCVHCGAGLELACPSCGASAEPGERFCGECGKPLAARRGDLSLRHPRSTPRQHLAVAISPSRLRWRRRAPLDGERKTVTALFADIKGSMELIEDLDPEEARAIVDPALKLMMEAVHRYDGYVAQSTGDGIFALFGAPWRTRIIRSARSTRRCACRRS